MNQQMEMMLRRRNMIYIPSTFGTEKETIPDEVKMYVTALNYNMMQLGFKLSKETFDRLCQCEVSELDKIYKNTIDSLKSLKGADVKYEPMWPNFPKEVMEMDEVELYFNAFIHYLSGGTLIPDIEKESKLPSIDFVTPKEVSFGDEKDFETLMKTLLNQTVAYSQRDKEDLQYLMKNFKWKDKLPEKYVNKENLATTTLIARSIAKKNLYAFYGKYQTATDVLRLISGMSGGDVSLCDIDKVKFKSNTEVEIQTLLKWLNKCSCLEEDIARNQSVWKKVFYAWHPGQYDMSDEGLKRKIEQAKKAQRYYQPKITKKDYEKNYANVIKTINKLNNNDLPRTFASLVQKEMDNKNYGKAAKLLATRPGEMARNMDVLLRNANYPEKILDIFEQVASKASPTVLCSTMSHFKHAQDGKELRTFFPKGNTAKSYVIEETRKSLSPVYSQKMVDICKKALEEIYKEKQPYGKIYVAEDVEKFKAPMVLRNASKTGRSIPRGSRIPMDKDGNGEKTNNVIRGFLWWTNKGKTRVDIDLSATIFDKNWKKIDEITYYNLKGEFGCHSGDFVNGGPEDGNGVAEFVDINMDEYQKIGGKYVVLTAHNFTEYSFDETPCKFGWMERSYVNDREAFEPKTVKEAAILNCKSTTCAPVIMDIEDKEVIWADMSMAGTSFANNVRNTLDQSVATCYAVVNNEFTDLKDLIDIHTNVRGEYTRDPREADIIICDNPETVNKVIEKLAKEEEQHYMEMNKDKEQNKIAMPEIQRTLKETSKVITVNDPSVINAIFINPDKGIDKDLMPELKETESTLDEILENAKEETKENDTKTGLKGIVNIIQGER